MPLEYISRDGSIGGIDTKTALTTLGSETAPGSFVVPAGKSRIDQIIIAFASTQAAVGSTGVFIRLEGNGLPDGPEVISAGAIGGTLATGGAIGTNPLILYDCQIRVTPQNTIAIFGEFTDVDVGTIEIVVTLGFL